MRCSILLPHVKIAAASISVADVRKIDLLVEVPSAVFLRSLGRHQRYSGGSCRRSTSERYARSQCPIEGAEPVRY